MASDTGMAGKVALLLWAQTLGLADSQTTQLLVEPPWTPAVLWDRVTLTCQGSGTASAATWYKDGQRWGQEGVNYITVTESGDYQCDRAGTWHSPPVRVLNEQLVLQVPSWLLVEGDTVTLRCRAMQDMSVSRVRFYHGDKEVRMPLHGTELSLSPLQLNHSGDYWCRVWVNSEQSKWASSARTTLTVHVPVANATITPSPLAHQVHAGDPVTLRCSVQVGSAPVNFTWLHNGQEVAQGPVLDLGDVDVGHSGTYQCNATNQLGQDGHRVFWALSPELPLEVTSGSPWVTAVAAGVSGSLLFLVLLVAVIVGWHRWHCLGLRKQQERAPPDPPAPPEEGEVLYTHIVSTERAGGPPRATSPQVTYAELPGPHRRQRDPSDIYDNVL